jgi:hypothetical protein
MAIHSPVMNEAFGDTKKAINSPTSSGCPMRPKLAANGCVTSMLRFKNVSYASSLRPPVFCKFVSMTVGGLKLD